MKLWLGLALFSTAAALAAEEPAQFSGIVRHAITHVPVGKAAIWLMPPAGKTGFVRTATADGAFSFESIPPGDYHIKIDRRGFLNSGPLLRLAAGQKVTDFDLAAMPLASISGAVATAEGDPVPVVTVRVLAARWSLTGRRYEEIDDAETNDRGEFAVSNLEPGRYYLAAVRPERGPYALEIRDAAGTGELRLADRFYPDAASLDSAMPVELHAGDELTGIRFRMAWTPCFHVRGRAAGREVEISARAGPADLPWDAQSGAAGAQAFDLAGIAPGAYFLRVRRSDGTIGANLPVSVGTHDVEGLALESPQAEFRARVRFTGDDAPALDSISLHLDPLDGRRFRPWSATAQADGTVRLAAVEPGRYLLAVRAHSAGIYVQSVRAAGEELSSPVVDFSHGSVDLEIVLARGAGQVRGTAAAAAMGRAVLVPVRPRAGVRPAWFAEFDQSGGFSFPEIPPGNYLAFATTDTDDGLWMNREFLAAIREAGAAVEVAANGIAQVQLTLVPADAIARAMEALR